MKEEAPAQCCCLNMTARPHKPALESSYLPQSGCSELSMIHASHDIPPIFVLPSSAFVADRTAFVHVRIFPNEIDKDWFLRLNYTS